MRMAVAKLRQRITELERFDPNRIESRSEDSIVALAEGIEATLIDVFGAASLEYARYGAAKNIDTAPFLLNGTPIALVRHGLEQGRAMAVSLLEEAIAALEAGTGGSDPSPPPSEAAPIPQVALKPQPAAPAPEPLRPQAPPAVAESTPQRPAAEPARAIGRDVLLLCEEGDEASDAIVRFLSKAGLTPVIVSERSGAEPYGSADFAIVLVRAEEEGGPPGGPHRPRARQEVIARLFYSAGRLGSGKVCALVKDDIEIPATLGGGVACVPLDPYEGWQKGLLRAVEGAGYQIDWARALR
jgi:hypothetical protein